MLFKKIGAIVGLIAIVFGFAAMDGKQKKAAAAGTDGTATFVQDRLYPVEVQGKYGFINGKGEIVIEPTYDGLGYGYPSLPGGLVFVEDRAAKKQTYFNPTGEKLFECELRMCGIPYDGLALYTAKVQTGEGAVATRYGYMNKQGKVAIQPIYNRAFPFSDGLARVNLGKATGFINTKGELVTPYRYSQTSDFSDGMAAVSLSAGGKFGFIDKTGRLAVAPRFDYVSSFSDGAAAVSVNGKYGYIDKKGDYILKPQFGMAQPFSEGLAFVERNGVTFYIDKQGVKVIQNISAGGTFSGGLAPASRGRTYGYINPAGAFVIKSRFEWADSFVGNLAKVYLRSSESPYYTDGYIDRSGTIVWPRASRSE